MNKIITICGSMKFAEQMKQAAIKLETEYKYTVFQCVYFDTNTVVSAEDIITLNQLHLTKIDMSDGIFVVNVDGYIGEQTKAEIEYAKNLGKEIIYLEPKEKQ